jgi:nitroreductase
MSAGSPGGMQPAIGGVARGVHGGDTVGALLHPLLARRWSPTVFDESYEAPAVEVESLLEAARWAPSAGNSQPWAFITARRGDAVHARLLRHLAPSSARWAPTASILVVNVCHRYVEDTDWEFSEFALYDLGQAVAHMTLQAQSLGLFARQFRAFDQAGIAAEFDVPVHWQVTSMSAFGRLPPGVATPPAADADQSRRRRSLSEISWLSPPPSAEGDEGAQREPGGQ